LHSPMYFFLLNLALLDLGCISTTLPKAMANALWGTRDISYAGCAAQLHYGTLMDSRACATMAAAAWASGVLYSLLHTASTFSMPLCQGNAVDQFFCEIAQLLKLSCPESDYYRETVIIYFSLCLIFGCFVFIVVSYVQIFRAVLRMPSEQGRHKAFSTCLPHLSVVSLFVSTAMVAYLKPPSVSSPSLDLVVSFLYSVVPPALNPVIYSLRNQELKTAVSNTYFFSIHKMHASLIGVPRWTRKVALDVCHPQPLTSAISSADCMFNAEHFPEAISMFLVVEQGFLQTPVWDTAEAALGLKSRIAEKC
ncbi:olfactory receptor 14A16-like, partial [Meleagris gallopavo]|uniref:olfactory receptor 14A16-like n=1 Tax=Meleagris gallopavo TaxID=9103 RepID=UPI0012AC37BD